MPGAFNGDPSRLEEPNRLEICRRNSGQLALASGVHHGLEVTLPFLAGQSDPKPILQSFPSIRIADSVQRGGAVPELVSVPWSD